MLPAKLHLPSGRTVRLAAPALPAAAPKPSPRTTTAEPSPRPAPAEPAASSAKPSPRSAAAEPAAPFAVAPFAAALTLLAAPGFLSDEAGAPLDLDTLVLRDFHVLRALLTHQGHLPEEPAEFTCENCGAPFRAAPSSLLELGPFLDGELTDPDLDAPFPFGEPRPIPRIVLPATRPRHSSRRPRRAPAAPARARAADTVTFTERTVRDARALFRLADAQLTGRARALRVTPALVLGMGLVALGRERRTPVLAEALAAATDAAWAEVLAHWHDAAYPPRLFGLHRCAACDARNDLDAPLARELDRAILSRGPRASRAACPDLDTFERLVRAHADAIYAARGVRNIDLFVDDGIAACDDGGEPLLGSYTPGTHEDDLGVVRAPEVRLYYRTFRAEHRADPSFDVEAEIHETIDHEIEHHLNHLSGVDPLDDEEHAAIDDERLRRVGARETARRGRKAITADLAGFLRATWLLWLVVAIAAVITRASGR